VTNLPLLESDLDTLAVRKLATGLDSRLASLEAVGISDTIPVGTMNIFAGSSTPAGWLLCDGSAVGRSTYANLYKVLGSGSIWGVGDGATTFNLPDMRESTPVGVGSCVSVTGTTHGSLSAHDVYTLAQFKDDQGQGHIHNYLASTSNAGGGPPNHPVIAAYTQNTNGSTYGPSSDGTNGPPRTGPVTRGKRIGVNYIIKY